MQQLYFGDQLPPEEDVTTSKACGTVDFCQNKVNLKTSPEITVENDETVAETKDKHMSICEFKSRQIT